MNSSANTHCQTAHRETRATMERRETKPFALHQSFRLQSLTSITEFENYPKKSQFGLNERSEFLIWNFGRIKAVNKRKESKRALL